MKQLMLVLTGLTALSACSNGRERPAPATNKVAQRPDLTLPDTISRKDTSVTLASGDQQPVSAVEQQAPHPTRAAKPKARRIPRARVSKPVATAPSRPPEDTAVRGYAPTPPGDTSLSPDSASTRDSTALASAAKPKPPTDSAPARTDSLSSPAPTARESLSTATVDTVARTSRDSAVTRPSDSSATRADTVDRDSVAVFDTNAVAVAESSAAPAPPVTAASPVASRTLPAGTEIHTALDDSITSRRDTVGRQVSAHVMENVVGPDGRTLIAAGTPVRFTITRIRPSRSKGSQGRLALRADGIALSGQLQPVKADIRPVPRELRGRGVTGSEAAKVGGGAAAGAVIGGVVGKTKGAVIGGVAGAAAGAVVASQTATRDVVVKAKTPVVLVLTAPLVAP
jgi:hypothetical protein